MCIFPFQLRTFLTRGESDVEKILAWAGDGNIYYLAENPEDPGSRHLYK